MIFFIYKHTHTHTHQNTPFIAARIKGSRMTARILDSNGNPVPESGMMYYFNRIQIQSAKILLLPLKYEIIMFPSNHLFFQYCDSNFGLFSFAPCKVITLNPLCILFGIISLLLFDGSLSKVIGLLRQQ